jgi:tetratricopeptide (TPR) repeat protein
MDPDNAVVRLCVEGMEWEGKGQFEEASRLFLSAWQESKDDFESCIAAHYIARHQKSPPEVLRWNQEALNRANAVNDDRVQEFYPSLHLNMGKAYEDMGNREKAQTSYELAAAELNRLPPGPYRDMIQAGIERGLQRVAMTR